MRIILTGTRSFGAAVLDAALEDGHEVCAVWTPPNDRLDRKAAERGLPRYLSLSPPEAAELEADLVVAAHSHAFVSAAVRRSTRLGGVGYHPSLLPRHRGRDAVRWTIHLGDPVAGGSVYWLTENVDGGPLAAQDWCWVPKAKPHEDAVSKLWREELFPMGVRLLMKTLADLDRGIIVEVPQPEQHATWEPSWDRPPLHRPDLPQIGSGPAGFESRVDRSALRVG